MTRRLRIEWSSGAKVTALLSGPGEGPIGILLAHGAGAGQRHPFMSGLRGRLASAGIPTMTFDYPYAEAGRKAPDRLVRLLECHAAAHDRLAARVDRIVVAGKSMGGRVGGHLVAEHGAVAASLVFLGYPLVALGKTVPRPTDHLESCSVPMLFVQGERDRLGPPELVRSVVDRIATAHLDVISDADHGFRVPNRTGLDRSDLLDQLAARVATMADVPER